MENKGLFYDGISETPVLCDTVLLNGSLYLYLNDLKKSLLIWNLSGITSFNFDGTTLNIFYGNTSQQLKCSGDMALRLNLLLSGSNESLPPAKGKYKTLLLIITFCITLCIVTWVYLIPWLGEKAVSLVPVDLEIQIGKNLSETYTAGATSNDSASYYAQEFVSQLQLDDTYPLEIKVIESEEINAFAMPGGKIFIYTGILEKMKSYEELVALLGHEVTHVANRHSLKSIMRSAATGLMLSAFIGDFSGISSGLLSQINKFESLNYSRDLETEADDNGLDIMIQNKINPKGMLGLLAVLKEMSEEQPGLMKYLSTHPDTDSRILNISSNPRMRTGFPGNDRLEAIFGCLKNAISTGK
jgi:predicted Zn-dependent protease